MRPPRLLAFCTTISLVGCGGRTPLEAVPLDAAAPDGAEPDAMSENGLFPNGPCETPEGVRICGGEHDCPWLSAPTCAGYGCTRAGNAGVDAGVCWSDLADKGSRLCDACNDGEVCIFRDESTLRALPHEAARAMSVGDAREGALDRRRPPARVRERREVHGHRRRRRG